MRIRPFFWFFLAFTCISILIFAATLQMHDPAILQIHVQQQHIIPDKPAVLDIFLTDTQGVPIETAQISSRAYMTNMNMPANDVRTTSLGHGRYLLQLSLYMVGPWAIHVSAQADGFNTSYQTLYILVQEEGESSSE